MSTEHWYWGADQEGRTLGEEGHSVDREEPKPDRADFEAELRPLRSTPQLSLPIPRASPVSSR